MRETPEEGSPGSQDGSTVAVSWLLAWRCYCALAWQDLGMNLNWLEPWAPALVYVLPVAEYYQLGNHNESKLIG